MKPGIQIHEPDAFHIYHNIDIKRLLLEELGFKLPPNQVSLGNISMTL